MPRSSAPPALALSTSGVALLLNSEYVPLGGGGALVTVRVVAPLIVPWVALITDDPTATPVARPALVMLATLGVAELQVACPVMSRVLLSEYIPVATNCWAEPMPMEGFAGVTAIEVSDAALV